MIKPTPRTSLPSLPEAAALAEAVSRVRGVQLPRMRDQRSVTRRILDDLRERVSLPTIAPPSLSDSRG